MASTPQRPDVVRGEVRRMLDKSASFRALPPERRREIARNMADVVGYLADDPGWLDHADQAEATGADAHASRAIDRLRAGVRTVDFPAFVSALVSGVFQAIVDASIQQMDAYGQLLEDVAHSVEQFVRDDGELGSASPTILRSRQKTLATMVLLGINRIVVTNAGEQDEDDEPTRPTRE